MPHPHRVSHAVLRMRLEIGRQGCAWKGHGFGIRVLPDYRSFASCLRSLGLSFRICTMGILMLKRGWM